jgi:hypothetical protein
MRCGAEPAANFVSDDEHRVHVVRLTRKKWKGHKEPPGIQSPEAPLMKFFRQRLENVPAGQASLPDSTLIATRVGLVRRVLCAPSQPAVTMSVWPSGCVCHADRAPGSKVTYAHDTRAGSVAAYSGSSDDR